MTTLIDVVKSNNEEFVYFDGIYKSMRCVRECLEDMNKADGCGNKVLASVIKKKVISMLKEMEGEIVRNGDVMARLREKYTEKEGLQK